MLRTIGLRVAVLVMLSSATPASGDSSTARLAVFSRSYVTNHYTSAWSGSAWGTATQYSTGPDESIWVRAANCPTRNEIAIATFDYSQDIRLIFNSAGVYSVSTLASSNASSTLYRRFDVAYERSSGDMLLVYWNNATASLGYRTASGTTVSAQSTLSLPVSGNARWVAMVPKPASDEILLLCGLSGSQLVAFVWNGTSFGSPTTLTTTLSSNIKECFSGAYETTSGNFMVAYGSGTSAQARYRTYASGSWAVEQSMPATSAAAQWLRLASKPGSNEMACAILDDSDAVFALVWSGSAWGTVQSLGSTAGVCEHRRIDVAYEPSGSKALAAYSTGSGTLRYRTWNGSSWSAQHDGPNFGGVVSIVQLQPGNSGSEILGLCSDEDWQLNGFAWNGTTLASAALVNDPLGGEANCEAFAIVPPSTGVAKPKLKSWSQAKPD